MQLHFPQSAYILGESFICIFIVAQLFVLISWVLLTNKFQSSTIHEIWSLLIIHKQSKCHVHVLAQIGNLQIWLSCV